jgi:hypothetical protein
MLVLVGVMAFIVVGGAFAGMRLGLFGGGDEPVPAENVALLDTAPGGAGPEEAAPESTAAADDATAASAPADSPASSANAASAQSPATPVSSGSGSRGTASSPASSSGAPEAQPRPTETASATDVATPPSAPAAPALPETPAVSFRCEGAAQVCGALRSAMTDAIGRHSLRPVSNEGAADVRVVADVVLADESSEQLFGSTFVIRTYSVEFSGESRDGDLVSMPAPTTLTFDAAYAQQKLPNDARTMATDAAARVRTYWRQRLTSAN